MITQVTVVHRVSGDRKVCTHEGYPGGDKSPFVQLRWPNGSGCYNFSLNTGWIEHKRSEVPDWFISDAEIEGVRAEAKEAGRKFTPVPRNDVDRRKPRRPRKGGPVHPRQVSMFREDS